MAVWNSYKFDFISHATETAGIHVDPEPLHLVIPLIVKSLVNTCPEPRSPETLVRSSALAHRNTAKHS